MRGLVPIAHGSIKINGVDPNKAKGLIGYVPQREEFNWKFHVTVRQVVQMGITKNNSFFSFTSTHDQDHAVGVTLNITHAAGNTIYSYGFPYKETDNE